MTTPDSGPPADPVPEPDERDAPTAAPTDREPAEPTRERVLRHALRVRLYSSAAAVVGLLIVLVLLISVNLRTVKIDWVFGSTRASLVWIVLAATVLGWLLGIATSVSFRHRTRRRWPRTKT